MIVVVIFLLLIHPIYNIICFRIKAFFLSGFSNGSRPLLDGHNTVYVPGTTSPSYSILGLVGENVRKSINICAIGSSRKGSDDDNIFALGISL